MDLDRILSRLRSRHLRTRKTFGRRPLIEHLSHAIHNESIRATTAVKECREKAQDLQNLFTTLESTGLHTEIDKAEEIIIEIVRQAYTFSIHTNLDAVLRAATVDPTLKKYLPEAIGKLGRYYSATSELVCAARHKYCRVFERIEIEPYQIPLPTSLQRSDWKVHAEIQLLFFYEVQPHRRQPRFICSSKSACYMCDLFFSLHGEFYVPRTHGRLYDKWILPDWLDIPVERHRELGRISTLLKSTIDGKVLRASKAKWKKQYHYPNEIVLLPLASWSSSGLSSQSSAQASTSTVRPRSRLDQEEISITEIPQRTALPLTPPGTPPGALPGNASVTRLATEIMSNSDSVSLITIGDKELPYNRIICLSTPSLHVKLGTLSLTLEFLGVLSGRLSITQVENRVTSSPGYHIISIEDIPTTDELQLDCSHDSNELTVQLRTARIGIVYITFMWGRSCR